MCVSEKEQQYLCVNRLDKVYQLHICALNRLEYIDQILYETSLTSGHIHKSSMHTHTHMHGNTWVHICILKKINKCFDVG